MIFQIINNVALAYTDSSGTTSALVIPSGLVRLCPTTACHISGIKEIFNPLQSLVG